MRWYQQLESQSSAVFRPKLKANIANRDVALPLFCRHNTAEVGGGWWHTTGEPMLELRSNLFSTFRPVFDILNPR